MKMIIKIQCDFKYIMMKVREAECYTKFVHLNYVNVQNNAVVILSPSFFKRSSTGLEYLYFTMRIS